MSGDGVALDQAPGRALVPFATSGLDAIEALVRDCAASGVGRRVLLLRTDLLPARLSRPHHLRLARSALDPLTTADRARAHDLPNGRIAVSWRGQAPMLLQQSLGALEHLLGDGFRIGPALVQSLVRLFDLPHDGPALLEAAGVKAASPRRRRMAVAPVLPPPLLPLDAAALSAMERQLVAADMARFARRKPICRVDGPLVHLSWEKRYLSISELTATLAPGRSAQADAWLFRRLTRILDRRMLALLASPQELRGAGPFSLNLNVGSVLSPEFLRFDAALPGELRGRVVLDMLPADVLADPSAFAFARGFARARGYRMLLRGITSTLLPLLNLAAMELDFAQLRWSPDLADAAPTLLQAGTTQWVLTQVHEPDALAWGQSIGIGLYQGRAVVMTTG